MTPAEMVREFMDAFGMERRQTPGLPSWSVIDLWVGMVEEESNELSNALRLSHLVKEACDVVYVALGFLLACGVDPDAAIAEVHRSNMSKLGPDGKPINRDDGKVLKGPNYQPPDLRRVLGYFVPASMSEGRRQDSL